jgi:Cysteine rich repeat
MLARQLAVAGLLAFAMLTPRSTVPAAEAADALTYCKSDMARLCPGVEPGGGRIIGCLKEHKMEMSVGCAKALQKMKGQMGK